MFLSAGSAGQDSEIVLGSAGFFIMLGFFPLFLYLVIADVKSKRESIEDVQINEKIQEPPKPKPAPEYFPTTKRTSPSKRTTSTKEPPPLKKIPPPKDASKPKGLEKEGEAQLSTASGELELRKMDQDFIERLRKEKSKLQEENPTESDDPDITYEPKKEKDAKENSTDKDSNSENE
jgi:hypothetical protein